MKSKNSILIIGITVLSLVGLVGIALFVASPTLTFSFELDGKPLPADRTPVVKVDGQNFVPGTKLRIGQHSISVSLQNAEPFEKTIWVTTGSKNLGALPLVSITGTINVSTYPKDCKRSEERRVGKEC